MDQAKILVVEDEPIVARDIQVSLQRLGYDVPMTASSGEEALRKAGELRPDLVIMDVVLKGPMDGIEAAEQMRRRFDVPVIYLTAYADDQTLERAKTSSPAGYMLKPYQPNALRTNIEVALHRSQSDRHLRESLRWLATTVRCMGDAVMTTNRGGRLTYMSSAAEVLTGWTQKEALGIGLTAIMSMEEGEQLQPIDNPAMRAMTETRIVNLERVVLVGKGGGKRLVTGNAAPVADDTGVIIGSVIVLRDVPGADELTDPEANMTRIRGVINLCAWCKRVPDKSGEWYDLETFIAEHSSLQFNGGLCPDCMNKCFHPGVVGR
ncbi:MAG: response regulator [Nitrospiraceae bacterium]